MKWIWYYFLNSLFGKSGFAFDQKLKDFFIFCQIETDDVFFLN